MPDREFGLKKFHSSPQHCHSVAEGLERTDKFDPAVRTQPGERFYVY